MKKACCQPIGTKCGTLIYDPKCPPCMVAARLVHLADITGSITLDPHPRTPEPLFIRTVRGETSSIGEEGLYGEVVAELLQVDRLPLQWALNDALRLLMNVARAFVVLSHGESVSLSAVLLRSKVSRA